METGVKGGEIVERITGRIGYALAYVGERRKDARGDVPGEMSVQAVMDVLGRLSAYEDTGLEPGEIKGRIFRAEYKAERAAKASVVMRIVGLMDAIGQARGARITEGLAQQVREAADRLAEMMEEEVSG